MSITSQKGKLKLIQNPGINYSPIWRNLRIRREKKPRREIFPTGPRMGSNWTPLRVKMRIRSGTGFPIGSTRSSKISKPPRWKEL